MSDQLPGLRPYPDRQAAGQEPRPARARRRCERYEAGAPLVDGTVAVGGTRPARRVAARAARPARHRVARRTADPRAEVQGPGLRRHRPHRRRPARWRSATSSPRCCAACDLPAGRRARHAAGAGHGLRAGRPARPRGLHPLARQGDRPRRHRPARLRRREGRGRGRLHAGLPALPQVGVRLGPGRPDRHPRPATRPRSPTGRARSPARSRWSPAPAAASASRSPGCSTATARPSSGSTSRRPPASCRR